MFSGNCLTNETTNWLIYLCFSSSFSSSLEKKRGKNLKISVGNCCPFSGLFIYCCLLCCASCCYLVTEGKGREDSEWNKAGRSAGKTLGGSERVGGRDGRLPLVTVAELSGVDVTDCNAAAPVPADCAMITCVHLKWVSI